MGETLFPKRGKKNCKEFERFMYSFSEDTENINKKDLIRFSKYSVFRIYFFKCHNRIVLDINIFVSLLIGPKSAPSAIYKKKKYICNY